jgi:UDP:flavonoid glycosyltransferase YjiC (YdhE family)
VARFLIATLPVRGHVAPMATVVRALADAGHDLVWYTGAVFQKRVQASGAWFVPIASTLDYGDSDYDKHFPGRARLSGLNRVKFDFKHVFIDAIPGYMQDLGAILDGFPADALLGDPAVVANRFLGQRRGLPWAILNITVLGLPSRDVAPFGLGLLPSQSRLGRLRNHTLNWVGDNIVFRDVNQHFAKVSRELGFEPFPFKPSVSPYLFAADAASLRIPALGPAANGALHRATTAGGTVLHAAALVVGRARQRPPRDPGHAGHHRYQSPRTHAAAARSAGRHGRAGRGDC